MNKIEFRIPSISDYENVKSIWEDERTMADVGGVFPIDETDYLKWFDRMFVSGKNKNCYYLIFFDDACAGEVSFHRFDPVERTAELNIKVKHEYRRKGIGKKALDHILTVFFKEWYGIEMFDTLRKENTNGIESLKAYGFKETGTDNDGNIVLKMTKKEFLSSRI